MVAGVRGILPLEDIEENEVVYFVACIFSLWASKEGDELSGAERCLSTEHCSHYCVL